MQRIVRVCSYLDNLTDFHVGSKLVKVLQLAHRIYPADINVNSSWAAAANCLLGPEVGVLKE
jgi:hypothetical protein